MASCCPALRELSFQGNGGRRHGDHRNPFVCKGPNYDLSDIVFPVLGSFDLSGSSLSIMLRGRPRRREWTILRVEATGHVLVELSGCQSRICPQLRVLTLEDALGHGSRSGFLTTEAVELLRLRAIIGWSRAMEAYRPTIAIPMCTRSTRKDVELYMP